MTTKERSFLCKWESVSRISSTYYKSYVVVDSDKPVELLLVFSALSNWREGGQDTHRCHLPTPIKSHYSRMSSPGGGGRPSISVSLVSDQQQRSASPSSIPEPISVEVNSTHESDPPQRRKEGRNKVLSASLVMEIYSWRNAQFGEPVLQVSTTGVKGATYSIPEG